MDVVTIRELRNRGGDVVERVISGRRAVITRDGVPVAELVPLRRTPLDSATLVERWQHLPRINAERLRQDIDSIVDQTL